jgi:hypothetical protein
VVVAGQLLIFTARKCIETRASQQALAWETPMSKATQPTGTEGRDGTCLKRSRVPSWEATKHTAENHSSMARKPVAREVAWIGETSRTRAEQGPGGEAVPIVYRRDATDRGGTSSGQA